MPGSCPIEGALAAKQAATAPDELHELHVRPSNAPPSDGARVREQEAKAMDRELVRETVRVPLRSLVGLTATVEQLTRQVRGLEARLSDAHEAYVKGPPGS